MNPTMLDHALALVRGGYEVFPLAGKVPAIAGGNGCWDASHDPQVVRDLWGPRPEANIGIHVAQDQLVVDIDPRYGGDVALAVLQQQHDELPATRTAVTGRGDGGVHLTFQHPGGTVTKAGLPKGIDLKYRGGYVVAPPSLHPDTHLPYRWADLRAPRPLPAWFITLIRPMTAPVRHARSLPAPKDWSPPGRRLEALVQFVIDSPVGERNNRLFWAARRGAEMVMADLYGEQVMRALLHGAGQAAGLPTAEVHGTVASAFRAGRRAG